MKSRELVLSDDYEIEIRKVPMLDTGIGREMGFDSDADFLEHAHVEREKALELLTSAERARFEEAEAEAERRFLFGSESLDA